MVGRVKRKQAQQQATDQQARTDAQDDLTCALCDRPLGTRIEWHHPVPKSKGGTETVPVHPICHRAIHAFVSNHDLATAFADLHELRARDDMRRFLQWVANKPADFNAPTRRRLT